jgi:hypothetical protein
MKTYAQENNKLTFDWNAFLDKKSITSSEWMYALKLAGSWVTCACGTMCSVIPRRSDGEPEDNQLYSLGMQFYDAIDIENADLAKDVLIEIEKRSAELIKQIPTP